MTTLRTTLTAVAVSLSLASAALVPAGPANAMERGMFAGRGMQAGANHYLTKSSFQDHTLLKTVERLIGEALA